YFFSEKILTAGPSRQLGSDNSTGEVLIYQDADDLPHSKRVQIINHLFENNDILHLNHSYCYSDVENQKLDMAERICSTDIFKRYFPNSRLTDCINVTRAYGSKINTENFPVHAGAVA